MVQYIQSGCNRDFCGFKSREYLMGLVFILLINPAHSPIIENDFPYKPTCLLDVFDTSPWLSSAKLNANIDDFYKVGVAFVYLSLL